MAANMVNRVICMQPACWTSNLLGIYGDKLQAKMAQAYEFGENDTSAT